MPINTCSPAHPIIEKLGGRKVVATHLGLSLSAVCRWCAEKPVGTGGRIPHKHWNMLLALAERRGMRLSVKTLAGF